MHEEDSRDIMHILTAQQIAASNMQCAYPGDGTANTPGIWPPAQRAWLQCAGCQLCHWRALGCPRLPLYGDHSLCGPQRLRRGLLDCEGPPGLVSVPLLGSPCCLSCCLCFTGMQAASQHLHSFSADCLGSNALGAPAPICMLSGDRPPGHPASALK